MSFLTDLRDRGAIPETGERSRLDVVISLATATLVIVVPLYSPLERLFASAPAFARILHIGLPVGLLALACHVITFKQRSRNAAGFTAGQADARPTYAYSSGTRWAAKAVLLPLSLVGLWEVFDNAPNALFGRNVVRAFLHDPSGIPVANVTLALYDRFGNQISADATTDDTGFVFLYPKATAARPVTWTAIGSCMREHLPIQAPHRSASGSAFDPPRKRAFSWTLPCRPK